MKSVILAAGYGTWGYPLNKDISKPLLPIKGKPVIEYIVNKIQDLERVDEIFIVTNGRFFSQFKDWADKLTASVPVKIINDGTRTSKEKLGAVRDLGLVINEEKISDDILVVGGDNLFSFTLADFIQSSLAVKPSPLIGTYNLNGRFKPKKFGMVMLSKDGRVIDFHEKPAEKNGASLASVCLYFFPNSILSLIGAYIKKAGNGSFNNAPVGRENDLSLGGLIKWLAKQSRVHSYEFRGDWFDISDMESYTEAVCSF